MATNAGGLRAAKYGVTRGCIMGLVDEVVALDLMQSLKRLFDPHKILNPGKMNLEV